jgi:hypothetical protein
MQFQEVMAYYDYKMIRIAKALRVTRKTVNLWKEKNSIPFTRQCELQIITDNKLIANREDENDTENNVQPGTA